MIESLLQELASSFDFIVLQTKLNSHYLLWIMAIYWGLFLISRVEKRILFLGIVPRHLFGLPGIIFAPFLHANFNHLFFNSIPLIVLSNFILLFGIQYYLLVSVEITLLSGFLIWCFARPGLHIGASALITGYWALLVSNMLWMGGLTAIILGLISAYYFAGIFLGIFPGKRGVSWQGHLFGLISGFVVSYLN